MILAERPSVRGILIGFISEYKLQRTVFSDARIHRLKRYDDHDRSRPSDFSFEYQGELITVEVKSLQTSSVRSDNGGFTGKIRVDKSDKSPTTLPDGSQIQTTCLEVGKWDILAANLFEFGHQWRFGFIRNRDLPRTTHAKYSEYQRRHLLRTTVSVTWPLEPPFYDNPFGLLRDIVRERRSQ